MSGLLWFSTAREGSASRLWCAVITPSALMQQCPAKCPSGRGYTCLHRQAEQGRWQADGTEQDRLAFLYAVADELRRMTSAGLASFGQALVRSIRSSSSRCGNANYLDSSTKG